MTFKAVMENPNALCFHAHSPEWKIYAYPCSDEWQIAQTNQSNIQNDLFLCK